MQEDHVVGQDPAKKKWQRPAVIIGFIVLAIALVYGAYRFITRDKFDPVLRENYEKLTASAEPPSALDPSKTVELQESLNKNDYAAVRLKVRDLLKTNGLTELDKRNLNDFLRTACTQLADVSCLKDIINQQQKQNQTDIYLVVSTAQLAAQQNSQSIARDLYSQAEKYLTQKGGQKYVDELNKNSQVPLDYTEITAGAK